MTATRDHDVEAVAREMLRQTILKSGWYPALRGEERQKRINRDVDLHWHLMVSEARKRLEQGAFGNSGWGQRWGRENRI